LGDRRGAEAALAELVEQPVGHLEGAAEDADILAHDEDRLVAPHLLGHRVAQRVPHPQLGHQSSRSSVASISRARAGSPSGSSPESPPVRDAVLSWASPSTAGLGRSPSSSTSAYAAPASASSRARSGIGASCSPRCGSGLRSSTAYQPPG